MTVTGTNSREDKVDAVKAILAEKPGILKFWKEKLTKGDYADDASKAHLVELIAIAEDLSR